MDSRTFEPGPLKLLRTARVAIRSEETAPGCFRAAQPVSQNHLGVGRGSDTRPRSDGHARRFGRSCGDLIYRIGEIAVDSPNQSSLNVPAL